MGLMKRLAIEKHLLKQTLMLRATKKQMVTQRVISWLREKDLLMGTKTQTAIEMQMVIEMHLS